MPEAARYARPRRAGTAIEDFILHVVSKETVSCPVAEAGAKIAALVDADDRFDERSYDRKGTADEDGTRRTMLAMERHRLVLEEIASHERPTSPDGAVLSLMLARADVDMIASRLLSSPADAASPARVDRYLYPVTRMLAGPNPPDWLARLIDFYRTDWHDPQLELDTALAGRREAFQGTE
ncbi:hypothetical protein [Segnochrobactrum spirostomi]|uniref:Uncharacterized protein n=1 Tax=Segnochrobactrum spirostomi TaxID=2608987 RepID=A0A6A7Y047_9HYPH|nr:hypothetical protein [Segnochrobactrum spirostomi]MQT11966.1 hypothetical protein [Segnochrobactrum spirostomi]